jgi:hypothetical protein
MGFRAVRYVGLVKTRKKVGIVSYTWQDMIKNTWNAPYFHSLSYV